MWGSPNITMATRKKLEEMTENRDSHLDEPDVKEHVGGTELETSGMGAHEEAGGIQQWKRVQD